MTLFRASPDRLVNGVTIATATVLLGMAAGFAAAAVFSNRPGWQRAIFVAVVVLDLGILGGSWAFHPSAYATTADAVVVHRPAGDVRLPLAAIRDVREDPEPFDGATRVAGNGGLFGVFGRFRSSRMQGDFTAYATRYDRGVVFVTDDRPVVVTPDDPGGMVAAVARRLGTTTRRNGSDDRPVR